MKLLTKAKVFLRAKPCQLLRIRKNAKLIQRTSNATEHVMKLLRNLQ